MLGLSRCRLPQPEHRSEGGEVEATMAKRASPYSFAVVRRPADPSSPATREARSPSTVVSPKVCMTIAPPFPEGFRQIEKLGVSRTR